MRQTADGSNPIAPHSLASAAVSSREVDMRREFKVLRLKKVIPNAVNLSGP